MANLTAADVTPPAELQAAAPTADSLFLFVGTDNLLHTATVAQARAILAPPPLFSPAPPGTAPGVAGQLYYYKRTTAATDLYVYQTNGWVKKDTFNTEAPAISLGFNSQGNAAYTFLAATAGTYLLPASGADLTGITNPQYSRNGSPVSGTIQFLANDVLTATATTTTGGQALLRQQPAQQDSGITPE